MNEKIKVDEIEDILNKELDKTIWGELVKKTKFYKKWPRDTCLHLRNEDTVNLVYAQTITRYFNIPINPPNSKMEVPYLSKYLFKWLRMLIDTFWLNADRFGLNPLEYTDERLEFMCNLFKKCNNIKEIDEFVNSRDNLISNSDKKIKYTFNNVIDHFSNEIKDVNNMSTK